MMSAIAAAAARALDAARATTALLPNSVPAREVESLVADGHPAGGRCEMAFSVSCADAASARDAAATLRAAGWTVDEEAASRGFLTAQGTVRLRPFDVALAAARIERAVRPLPVFVEIVGAVGAGAPAPRREAVAMPAWVDGGTRSAA